LSYKQLSSSTGADIGDLRHGQLLLLNTFDICKQVKMNSCSIMKITLEFRNSQQSLLMMGMEFFSSQPSRFHGGFPR